MPEKIRITLKHKDKIGCFVQLFTWKSGDRRVTTHRLIETKVEDGKYLLESVANLSSGYYHLRVDLKESGNEAEAEVEGEPLVVFPFDVEWPLAVSVPSTAVGNEATYIFKHGEF